MSNYYTFQYTIKISNMIIRLKNCLPSLALISKIKATCTTIVQPLYYHEKMLTGQIQKLQKCKSVREVLKLSYNMESLQINEIEEIFQKIVELKYTAKDWDGYNHLINKVLTIAKEDFSQNLLDNICNVIELINQQLNHGTKIYFKLIQKVSEFLENHQSLSNNQIISYMKLVYEVKNYQILHKLVNILDQRVDQLNSKQIINYFSFIKRRHTLIRNQKQLLNKIFNQISKNSDIINMNTKVLYYIELKGINKKFFKKSTVMDKLQSQLIQNIQKLQQKQLKLLLNNINQRNPVTWMILKKILNKICTYENGQTNVKDVQPIFQLLAQVSEAHNIGIQTNEQNQQKITNFFMKNLKYSTQIIQIIKNNFFRQAHLIEFHQYILKNNLTDYLESYRYIYEIIGKGLLKNQKYQTYVTNLLNNLPSIDSNVYFMKNAIIIKKLYFNSIQANNKSQDTQYQLKLKQAYNHFINEINLIRDNFDNFKYFSKYMRNKKVLQEFNLNFKQCYLQKIGQIVQSQQYFHKLFAFLYFLYADDAKTMFSILKKNPNFIEQNMIKIILCRIKLKPQNLQNSYGLLFEILLKIQISDFNKKLLQQILCKQQLHILLKPQQIISMMKLSTKLVKELPKKNGVFSEFVNFIISLTDITNRCVKQYKQFLQEVQNKVIGINFVYLNIFPLTFQLIRLNAMKPEIAQKLLSIQQTMELNKNYCKIVSNKPVQWNKLAINQQNLLLIFKGDPFVIQKLNEIQTQIIKQINKCNSFSIEEYLINFEMESNKSSDAILDSLFRRYSQVIIPHKLKNNLKVDFVLKKFSSQNMSHIKEYKNFLTVVINHFYDKFIDRYYITSFNVLLEQCLKYNVECNKFTQKIINLLNKKQFKFNSQNDMSNFLRTLLMTQPVKWYKIVSFMKKQVKYQQKLKLLPIIAILSNYQQQQYKSEMKLFIQEITKNNEQIPQSIIKYLANKDSSYSKYLKKQAVPSEFQSKWLNANLCIWMTHNKLFYYQSICKNEHNVIRYNGKIIICVNANHSESINKKLKQFYGQILQTKIQNIVILYAFPMNSCHYKNAQILCKQFPHLSQKKQQIIEELRRKPIIKNQGEKAITKNEGENNVIKNSMQMIKKLMPKISHIL